MWLVSRFWPYLLGAGAIIGLGLCLHHRGYESGFAASEAKWQPLFAAAEKARDAANEKARRKEEDSIHLTQNAEAEYAKTVASLNLHAADADKRIRALSLRLAATSACRGEVPTVPGAPDQPDAAAASAERAQRAGASISDIGRRCELDSLSLSALQRWITEQRAIINR